MENNQKEESSVGLLVLSLLGIFLLPMIIQPVVLYFACKRKTKDACTTITIIISGILTAIFALALLAVMVGEI